MRALAHLVPRAPGEGFDARMQAMADALAARASRSGIEVGALARIDDDPFGRTAPFRFTLELRGGDAESVRALVEGLGARHDDAIHADLSTLLVGEDAEFVEGAGPVRYQYLMRRRADFDHAAYLRRYRDVHSAFGIETPGIAGYVQLHVDPDASRSLAAAAGLGVWGVDSVSELHLESVEAFLAAIKQSDVGPRAIEDEEHFVDRAQSVAFCSRVVR